MRNGRIGIIARIDKLFELKGAFNEQHICSSPYF